MLNHTQMLIMERSMELRLKRGEDIVEIFKNYRNLTSEEKGNLLSRFAAIPYEPNLDEIKAEKIRLSNELLAVYIKQHPLVTNCHGNKVGTYTITEEKRNMFTSKYTAHIALQAAGIHDIMTWNEAGQPCEPWTDEECIKFIAEWNAISTPLVAYQQETELNIKNAVTKEAIEQIKLDYSKVDPRTMGAFHE
ncbi:hypothetical protein AALB16_10690 [Lachnospiraceae bacterium 62-35]